MRYSAWLTHCYSCNYCILLGSLGDINCTPRPCSGTTLAIYGARFFCWTWRLGPSPLAGIILSGSTFVSRELPGYARYVYRGHIVGRVCQGGSGQLAALLSSLRSLSPSIAIWLHIRYVFFWHLGQQYPRDRWYITRRIRVQIIPRNRLDLRGGNAINLRWLCLHIIQC